MPLIISCYVVLYCIILCISSAILIYIHVYVCINDEIAYIYHSVYTLIYTHDVCMYTKHIPSISFNLFGWLLYNRCCAFPSTVQWMKVFSKYTLSRAGWFDSTLIMKNSTLLSVLLQHEDGLLYPRSVLVDCCVEFHSNNFAITCINVNYDDIILYRTMHNEIYTQYIYVYEVLTFNLLVDCWIIDVVLQ